ncbi:hypothetical protein Bca52824_035916 [Brassica carinata]|uniref:Viral late gene transcription factor 3 zinc ribbon domain-containing protein n=1 Tax=Brassica carinata TaxID=52824 RepID=A0A8X7V257_BRACI|nr:hypothetical protein Bca52824_035916 [Brassica carinata]
MEASSSLCLVPSLWTVGSGPRQKKSTVSFVSSGRSNGLMISNRRLRTPSALGELADTVAETGKSEITWSHTFVVAGVEFSKRIIEQKRCEECRGSGLVFRDKKYFRCPGCGGFLPWQSWRRFFSG